MAINRTIGVWVVSLPRQIGEFVKYLFLLLLIPAIALGNEVKNLEGEIKALKLQIEIEKLKVEKSKIKKQKEKITKTRQDQNEPFRLPLSNNSNESSNLFSSSKSFKFLFLTYSLSPALEYDNGIYTQDEESESMEYGDSIYKESVGLKGHFLKKINTRDLTFLIGLGGSLNLKSKYKGTDEDNPEIAPATLYGLFAKNIANENINLIPYVGIGIGNIRYKENEKSSVRGFDNNNDPITINYSNEIESTIGLSYEFGLNFNIKNFVFGISHQVIKGKVNYTNEVFEIKDREAKLNSTLLNVGLSF